MTFKILNFVQKLVKDSKLNNHIEVERLRIQDCGTEPCHPLTPAIAWEDLVDPNPAD